MRSSTSGSDVARATRLLLVGCMLVALTAEGLARFGLDRVSRIQRRTADEHRLASAIGTDQCGRRHVLLVGNSLLEEDVQFERVREALAPAWDARRFVVEQTYYYDWYYGLRRLLREGARPDLVVLMMSSRQWVHPGIRGDYSAQYLMSTEDLPAAATDLRLDATGTANLVFARVSKFWGARAEIRNFMLGRLVPDLGQLMNFSAVVDPHALTDTEVEPVASARIAQLRTLLDAHGARLVILFPVLLSTKGGNGFAGLRRAAEAAGVPALLPGERGQFPRELYRDAGLHLNPKGAKAFTECLIPVLRQQLSTMVARDTAESAGVPSRTLVSRAIAR